jgi:hypothetical protein
MLSSRRSQPYPREGPRAAPLELPGTRDLDYINVHAPEPPKDDNHMLSKDEPDHKRLRDIVDEAFRRRAVLEMEPRILAITDLCIGMIFLSPPLSQRADDPGHPPLQTRDAANVIANGEGVAVL